MLTLHQIRSLYRFSLEPLAIAFLAFLAIMTGDALGLVVLSEPVGFDQWQLAMLQNIFAAGGIVGGGCLALALIGLCLRLVGVPTFGQLRRRARRLSLQAIRRLQKLGR